ncbi:YajG family lipoprotein [Shewanella sp. YIC-542]|uniref:YajG family lipoprotein n=1 Tax=Shewanella mytili TaxID=3377111 RepID=UPI00398F1E54
MLAASLLLAACASQTPERIALSPNVPPIQLQVQQLTPLALTATDRRQMAEVVRFNDQKPPRLVGTMQNMQTVMEQLFRQGFTQAGYQIDPASGLTLEITLEQLQTDVEESMLGFNATTQLLMSVQASNNNRTFSKRYSASSRLKGPLNADFATLELDINNLISQLAGKIINDAELNQFLQPR